MSHRDLTGQADEALVAALRTDPAALEEFYRRHVRGLTRYAARRMRDPSEAADLSLGLSGGGGVLSAL